MHKLIVLYRDPPDEAAFRQHYEAVHLPLVRRVPGVIDARASFAPGDGQGGRSRYACIGETLFDSEASMRNSLQTPEGKALIDDAANYAGTRFEMIDFPVADDA